MQIIKSIVVLVFLTFSLSPKLYSVDCLSFLSCTAGTCTCASVVPQVVENCRKQSTEGLALNQSAADAAGNLALISVILASPVSAHAAIAPCISVAGDAVVLAQAWKYDERCFWHEWTEHSEYFVYKCNSCRGYDQILNNNAPTNQEIERLIKPLERLPETESDDSEISEDSLHATQL
ncbi:MAG: PQ-loop repeat-containing protein [Oligoflexales bacterium]